MFSHRTRGVIAAVALLVGCQDPGDPEVTYLLEPAPAAGSGALLAAPANLTALAPSLTQIDISWENNAGGGVDVEVHRSPTGAPGTFSLLTTVSGQVEAYTDQGVVSAALYCYQTRAARVKGSTTTYSLFSNTACSTAAPLPVVGYASVVAGGAHSCALTAPGAAYCWGRAESGQLGIPPPPSTCLTTSGVAFSCSMIPRAVGGALAFTRLTGGGAHTCGLTGVGSAYCWGSNTAGQLGDNSTLDRSAPVPVATLLTFASIDAGDRHTCAVTSTGAAWCWGNNQSGELGDGTTTNRSAPVAVSGSLSFQTVAAGGYLGGHTCGISDTGDAYCWGQNVYGELGTGSTAYRAVPTPVSGGLTWAAVTTGGRHSCGLAPTGDAYCWGRNLVGALGTRSKRNSAVPVPVSGNLTFSVVVAGGFIGHTCGLTGSGAAYCWGDNQFGQLGDGSMADKSAPVAVTGGLGFTDLDAGQGHTCGFATTDAIYCWGSSGAGQLGNNSNSRSTVPVKVIGQP